MSKVEKIEKQIRRINTRIDRYFDPSLMLVDYELGYIHDNKTAYKIKTAYEKIAALYYKLYKHTNNKIYIRNIKYWLRCSENIL